MIRAPFLGPAFEPKRRKAKCKNCATPFATFSSFVAWCSPECGAVIAEAKLAKLKLKALRAERAWDKERKEVLKPRSRWLGEAQTIFNQFIRTRDAALGCISCGRMDGCSFDAGHYVSVGSNRALRFHEDNCHKQCVTCNQHLSGNAIKYRVGLTARLGVERVEFLEGPHEPVKHTVDDARAIKAHYKAKLKILLASRESAQFSPEYLTAHDSEPACDGAHKNVASTEEID